jgi:hypothetical protein
LSVANAVPNGSVDEHLNLKGMGPDTPSRSAVFAVTRIAEGRKKKLFCFGSVMPVLRYFIFVGGALLALLIGMSSFFPALETIAHPDAARPVIRIASDRVGPPRVDIDTRMQIAVASATVPTAAVPEILPQVPARVAQGQLSAPLPATVLPARIQRKKSRIAKRPDRQRMAANPQGFQPFPQGFQPFRLTW